MGKHSKIDTKYIVSEYLNGKSVNSLMKELRCGKHTIGQILRENNIKVLPKGKRDLIGQTIGQLLVLEEIQNSKTYNCVMYRCICECGEIVERPSSTLQRKSSRKTCDICLAQNRKDHGLTLRKYYGELSGTYWGRLKNSAIARNIPFNLSMEVAWNLYIHQNRKCKLSGIDLVMGNPDDKQHTASLDRIDSHKGYIIDNVQWIHKRINFMKGVLQNSHFVSWCKLIAEYDNKQDTKCLQMLLNKYEKIVDVINRG